MSPRGVPRFAGLFVALALVWALGGVVSLALAPVMQSSAGTWGSAQAAEPVNPCNPAAGAGESGNVPANPCNPCNPAKPPNPCNPCNPQEVTEGAPVNPCNPCNPQEVTESAPANPCNPCNPCNPAPSESMESSAEKMERSTEEMERSAETMRSRAETMERSASAGAMAGKAPAMMDEDDEAREEAARMVRAWREDYRGWPIVSGFVLSPSHGGRLVQTYAHPDAAAEVYRHNAAQRLERRTDFRGYPEGATFVQRSWRRNKDGGPGEPGPVFFMRKEAPGYDPGGGDWRYGLAGPDFRLIGQGHTKEMGFCKECHAQVAARDYLYSVDR